ncbi:MAG: TIGR04255 family protein [Oligoflexia bacterium]|nr:TIGR04255 family protein [Oligoflexia bacterium]
MKTMLKLNTPNFTNPPINEVVFGVTFKNSLIKTVDFGLFYQKIKSHFPLYSDQPPVLLKPPAAQVQFLLPRVWFENEDKTRLVQLQQDKFFFNWRQLNPPTATYPNFEKLFSEFELHFKTLQAWWSDNFNVMLELKSLELSYINHIDSKSDWSGPNDNHKVFSVLDNSRLGAEFTQTDTFLNSVFYRTDIDSDIVVSLKHGQRVPDGLAVAVYDITVREKARAKDDIRDWFTRAHNAIVDVFTASTTEDAQKKWGKSK